MHKRLGLFRTLNRMSNRATFGKGEKLKSRKSIDALFAQGRSVAQAPLRLKWALLPAAEAPPGVLAGFSVSKKHFKRAVHRNRIKRLLREAYRLQKGPLLLQAQHCTLHLFFLYTDKQLPELGTVQAAVAYCLQQLQQKIATPHEKTS